MTARNRKQARCPKHSRLPCDEWMPTGIERVPVRIAVGEVELDGDLSTPADALGVVLFAHGSGSSRFSPRNRHVAEVLNRARFATLLVDLLTSQEEAIDMRTARLRFDIGRLAERLIGSTDWLSGYPGTRGLSIGYFGASTGAGAALVAAPERTRSVAAIVSRGGRPDLAGPALPRVRAPTLLIVGGNDAGHYAEPNGARAAPLRKAARHYSRSHAPFRRARRTRRSGSAGMRMVWTPSLPGSISEPRGSPEDLTGPRPRRRRRSLPPGARLFSSRSGETPLR